MSILIKVANREFRIPRSPELEAAMREYLGVDVPPIPDGALYAGNVEEWLEALREVEPDGRILVGPGIYPVASDVQKSGITIEAATDEMPVFTARKPFDANWVSAGNAFRSDFARIPGLSRHPATREGVWQGHRDRMRPEQLFENDRLMRAVYRTTDLLPGTFMIEGPVGDPRSVLAIGFDGGRPGPCSVSSFARLLYSSAGARNVTIKDIIFDGCANTGKQGMVETGPAGWLVHGCAFRRANTVGLKVSGKDHKVISSLFDLNGQLGLLPFRLEDSVFINIVLKKNNLKGFNVGQEAGGLKGQYMKRVLFEKIFSTDNYGAGFWLDIWNSDITMREIHSLRDMGAGILLEHGLKNSTLKSFTTKAVRSWRHPVHKHSRQIGLQMQSNIFNLEVQDGIIEDVRNGVVIKQHERRGGSGNIRLRNIQYGNVQDEVYIERMNDSQIAAAIQSGATPAHMAGWKLPIIFENAGS